MIKKLTLIFTLIFTPLGALQAQVQTYALAPVPHIQFFSNAGAPVASGFLCIYAAGTTTPATWYSDNSGTALPDPIRLNSAGIAQTGSSGAGVETGLYLAGLSYKVNLYAAGTGNTCNGVAVGALIRTQDNVYDVGLIQRTALIANYIALPYAATMTFDTSAYSIFKTTLTGNVATSTLPYATQGAIVQITVCQDGTGSRTFAWPATVLYPPIVNATASACTEASFYYDGANWRGWGLNGSQSATGFTFTGDTTIAGNESVTGGLTVTGVTTLGTVGSVVTTMSGTTTVQSFLDIQQVVEIMNTKTGATGTVTHDFSTGAIWYHSAIAANFTANFTNVPVVANRAIGVTLILNQGGTGYYPNALQINGGAVTIKWQAAVNPTPSSNKFDAVTFSLVYTGSTWYCLGQLVSYN